MPTAVENLQARHATAVKKLAEMVVMYKTAQDHGGAPHVLRSIQQRQRNLENRVLSLHDCVEAAKKSAAQTAAKRAEAQAAKRAKVANRAKRVPRATQVAEQRLEALYVTMGVRLRNLRLRAGLSQEQVAMQLRPVVGRASIANMEAGKQRMLAHTLFQLMVVFDVPVEAFIGSDPQKVWNDARQVG